MTQPSAPAELELRNDFDQLFRAYAMEPATSRDIIEGQLAQIAADKTEPRKTLTRLKERVLA
jgi:hypothetical protein